MTDINSSDLDDVVKYINLVFSISPYKNFLFFLGGRCGAGVGGEWGAGRYTLPLLLPPVTLYWGGERVLSLYLSRSLFIFIFYISLSLYSLYPFFSCFLMVSLSLSCPHTLLYLSFVIILTKGWGMPPRGEGAVDEEGGKGMIIPEFLSLVGCTNTRSELNSLLSLPFFLMFF